MGINGDDNGGQTPKKSLTKNGKMVCLYLTKGVRDGEKGDEMGEKVWNREIREKRK
jgi:hypothetical protein